MNEDRHPRVGEDPFALFYIPPAFTVDFPALEATYFSLQRQYHPDRFATKPAEERAQAASISLSINEAYAVLKNPLLRAQYLLLRQGIRVNMDKDNVKPTPQLLMDVMELQDTLHDIDKVSLGKFIEQINAQMRACNETLADAFAKNDYARAADATLRLNYLTKISETARQKAFAAAEA